MSNGWKFSDLAKVTAGLAGVFLLMGVLGMHDKSPTVPTAPATVAPSSNAIDPAVIAAIRARSEQHQTFEGKDCTGNCSGHQAGYDWARDKLITDLEDCDVAGERYNSPSFAEGCRSYIEEGKYDLDTEGRDIPQDQDPPR